MKRLWLTLFTLPVLASAKEPLRHGTIINTDLNNVGIKAGTLCKISQERLSDGTKIPVINCIKSKRSIKVFRNYGTQESAITGTPGNILYENYIGYIVTNPLPKD